MSISLSESKKSDFNNNCKKDLNIEEDLEFLKSINILSREIEKIKNNTEEKNSEKNIIVLGGDGFCGWPTSLGLSREGYNVTIVDNLSRRKIDIELGCESLTPIRPMDKRIKTWQEKTGRKIDFVNLDVSLQYNKFFDLIKKLKPKAIIHFAEQRTAPYSMKTPFTKRYTVNNNLNATHNVLVAIEDSGLDIHLIHLGTMGVYGYGTAGMEIPEGYLNVQVKDENGISKEIEIMYPPNPGSVYHMTKCQDAMMFMYYNKNSDIRITDLHQGIVWGTNTEETSMHEDLVNRFDYDGDYGTVLNRFLMQASIGHPLTVHGSGGQTRAFIHIKDTVNCIKMAVKNPPKKGEKVKIFNQTAECLNVKDLAIKISKKTGAQIKYYINPRKEANRNDLKVSKQGFLSLGWKPILLEDNLLDEVSSTAKKYKHRCDTSKIICTSTWSKDIPVDLKGSSKEV